MKKTIKILISLLTVILTGTISFASSGGFDFGAWVENILSYILPVVIIVVGVILISNSMGLHGDHDDDDDFTDGGDQ